jgi:hypothetical protein
LPSSLPTGFGNTLPASVNYPADSGLTGENGEALVNWGDAVKIDSDYPYLPRYDLVFKLTLPSLEERNSLGFVELYPLVLYVPLSSPLSHSLEQNIG